METSDVPLTLSRSEYLRDPGRAFDAASRGVRVIVLTDDGKPWMTFSPCQVFE